VGDAGHRCRTLQPAFRVSTGRTAKIPYVSIIQGIICRETLFLPMRRLCVILLAAGCLVPAALAASTAVGDGTLAAANVNGTVTIVARGAIWGQIDKGSITILDRDPDVGPDPRVSNFESSQPGAALGSIVYTGSNLHFQIGGGGRYRIDLNGSGIDFTAVGTGRARLAGSWLASSVGRYAVGDDAWLPVAYQGTPAATSWIVFPADTDASSP
jgi:hypothetical protein